MSRRTVTIWERHAAAIAFCLILAASAVAGQLEFAGILGNSGRAGETLVRLNTERKRRDGSGLNCGAFLDANARVWLSGGDAVNCLDFEGRLMERSPLDPEGSSIDTTAFAHLDGALYFFGHLPKPNRKTRSNVALFALALDGSAPAKVIAEFPEYPSHRSGILCPAPREGTRLYAFPETRDEEKRIIVGGFAPDSLARTRLMDLPGHAPSALAMPADGAGLYLGGYFGKYVAGNRHHPRVSEIVCLDWDGRERWRRVCLATPAQPTQFRGVVSTAGGALWDTAWYGFLARFDSTGKPAPGKIASWDMRIPDASQIVDVRTSLGLLPPRGVAVDLDPLILTSHNPRHAYLATWNNAASKLILETRYGALPELGSIHLNANGWVNAGGLWWQFDDAANAPPRFANHTAPTTQGTWRGDWICALSVGKRTIPVVGRPAFGRASAQRSSSLAPPFQPKGFAMLEAANPRESVAYASDTDGKIWRSTVDARLWAPRKDWQQLTTERLAAPGDIVILDAATLLVVDGDSIVRLAVDGTTLRETARLAKWGDAPDQHFAPNLRLAGDGKHLLVSDTDRHRVLLLDAAALAPLAQFGTTDQAGTNTDQFDTPGSVAIAGTRAIVADTTNQRIVKLNVNTSQ